MSSKFYNEVIKPTIKDIKVELDEEFDKNFERKSYFNGSKWAPTKRPYSRGSLMVRSGDLRESIKSTQKSDGLIYTSDKPFARIHNEGGTIKFNSRKCADAYNRSLDQTQEFKLNTTPTKSAIDNQIRDANLKSDHVVIMIESDIDEATLTRGIKGRFNQANRLESITIIRGGKDIVYSKEDVLNRDFKASWAELK